MDTREISIGRRLTRQKVLLQEAEEAVARRDPESIADATAALRMWQRHEDEKMATRERRTR